jgi:hypothetical protein
MLFELVDSLQKKRRLLYIVAFISFDFWLLTLCSQTLQAHRSNIVSRIHDTEISSEMEYRNNPFATGTSMSRFSTSLEISTLHTTVSVIDGMTKARIGLQTAARATMHALGTALVAVVRAIAFVLMTIIRIIATIILAIIKAIGIIVVFLARIVAYPFVLAGRGVGKVFGVASSHTNLAAVIQPQNGKDVPVITPEQAQQATLIQQDTLAVTPTVKTTGIGGACDNGAGNGGYPMDWCDARMDSIATVGYTSDRINRECTSYAFWYFTTIEGHSDFHVTGNANRWARTSNYPTHPEPAKGAIAVETAGYYGHVAIVQGLPGDVYEGKVVPDNYVLVSEMNYDWQGHFRYSYSPLSKFSAYIYPN